MKAGLNAAIILSLALPVWAAASGAEASKQPLTTETRLEILRQIAYEYATTLQPLPASQKEKEALEVDSSGHINEEKLRQTLANRGVAVPPGEVVQITDLKFQKQAILLEINGGGKKKKKWYQRIQVQVAGTGGGGVVTPSGQSGEGPPMGSWILLNLNESLPEMSADNVKQMLAGVLDFNRVSATVPWIDTIKPEFKKAIEEKRAMVGMDKKMVLAALGRPERKVREVKDGVPHEDWIYGNPPFVTFVVFVNDEVAEVKEYQ
jgi:hypothetical protein